MSPRAVRHNKTHSKEDVSGKRWTQNKDEPSARTEENSLLKPTYSGAPARRLETGRTYELKPKSSGAPAPKAVPAPTKFLSPTPKCASSASTSRPTKAPTPRPSQAPHLRKRTIDGHSKHDTVEQSNLEQTGIPTRNFEEVQDNSREDCEETSTAPVGGHHHTFNTKYHYKLQIGIENDGRFRVASRVIRFSRQIWLDDKDFQWHGGKTRLRGRGLGGEHESDEPLTLHISCLDKVAAERALWHAEQQLQNVRTEYEEFCRAHGKPVPKLLGTPVEATTAQRAHGHLEAKSHRTRAAGKQLPADPITEPVERGPRPDSAPSEEDIELLIEERNQARKAGDWAKADEIRDLLKDSGVVLMDAKHANKDDKVRGADVTQWRYWTD